MKNTPYDPTSRRPELRAGMPSRFFAKSNAKSETGDLYIYDVIGSGWFGGIAAKDVAAALDDLKGSKKLNIYVNSPGGDVFDGVAIYNLIKRFDGEKTVHVDGLAASIASVIAMAGDKVITAHNAMWMIHDPWGLVMGNSTDARKFADELDKVRDVIVDTYRTKAKLDPEALKAMMTEETWMDAKTAASHGFTDEVTETEAASEGAQAFALLDKFNKTPERLRKQARRADVLLATMEQHILASRASPRRPGQPGTAQPK